MGTEDHEHRLGGGHKISVLLVMVCCLLWAVWPPGAAAEEARQTKLILPPSVAQGSAQKWALLVGVNQCDHPDKIASLNYARNDATLLYQALVDPGVGGFFLENTVLMTDETQGDDRPTNDNTAARLWALGQRVTPGDTFLFYLLGHGIVQDGASCLLTVNANPDNPASLAASSLRVDDLRGYLGTISAGQLLLVPDTCRHDPFAGCRATGSNPLKPECGTRLRILVGRGGMSWQTWVHSVFLTPSGQRDGRGT